MRPAPPLHRPRPDPSCVHMHRRDLRAAPRHCSTGAWRSGPHPPTWLLSACPCHSRPTECMAPCHAAHAIAGSEGRYVTLLIATAWQGVPKGFQQFRTVTRVVCGRSLLETTTAGQPRRRGGRRRTSGRRQHLCQERLHRGQLRGHRRVPHAAVGFELHVCAHLLQRVVSVDAKAVVHLLGGWGGGVWKGGWRRARGRGRGRPGVWEGGGGGCWSDGARCPNPWLGRQARVKSWCGVGLTRPSRAACGPASHHHICVAVAHEDGRLRVGGADGAGLLAQGKVRRQA